MKALIVTNYVPDRQESMLRFGELLARGLPGFGIATETIAPEPCVTRLGPSYRYNGATKYAGYVDKFAIFPLRLRQAVEKFRPDVVHIVDHGNSAYREAVNGCRVIVTCHDLLQIRAARGEIARHGTGWAGRRFQRWIAEHLARVPDVACVSAKTRDDLLRLVARRPDRTHLLYNGLNYPYAPVSPDEARQRLRLLTTGAWDGENPRFYLNVGGGQWYKNRRGLLLIFAALVARVSPPPRLVLVGKPLSEEDARFASRLELTPHLRHFSNVSNANLAALYTLASGLIFPSWEEGFGWPVAEAQACGCPVFTSDRPPLTEVGGSAAVYFDPADAIGAADRILAAQADEPRLRAEGLARAERWSTRRMLADYAALYGQLEKAA